MNKTVSALKSKIDSLKNKVKQAKESQALDAEDYEAEIIKLQKTNKGKEQRILNLETIIDSFTGHEISMRASR